VKVVHAVHQGFELYGSDRVFIRSLRALRAAWPEADIKVILPARGPLSDLLQGEGFEVELHDLWVLRRSLGLALIARMLLLPAAMLRAWRAARGADLVYISTTVILDYLLVARALGPGVIVHAHELPTGWIAKVFSGLLRWSGAMVMFISHATAAAYSLGRSGRSVVIHNGHDGPAAVDAPFYDGNGPLNLLMLGRINDWKGQDLLVEAASLLHDAERRCLRIKIVGDTFGGPERRDALQASLEAKGLTEVISIDGFEPDPSAFYAWSHIVMAPSRKPEPFGLIAIEGMSWARPVIAADHGGLTEIVRDGRTGGLFTPNDAVDLAAKIREYLEFPGQVAAHGAEGRRVYEQEFTAQVYDARFVNLVRTVTHDL
jgi:glycosyltransferase involved in cell wall biosynthesis